MYHVMWFLHFFCLCPILASFCHYIQSLTSACICEYGDFILHVAMCHVSWVGSWPTAQSPCILPVLWWPSYLVLTCTGFSLGGIRKWEPQPCFSWNSVPQAIPESLLYWQALPHQDKMHRWKEGAPAPSEPCPSISFILFWTLPHRTLPRPAGTSLHFPHNPFPMPFPLS